MQGSRTRGPEGTSISGMSVIIAKGCEGTVTDMSYQPCSEEGDQGKGEKESQEQE